MCPDALILAVVWTRTGRFLLWHNHSHYHTGLALMVPAVVHAGQEKAVRAARQQVLKEAYARHPERFARGVPKVGMQPKNAWINKPPDPAAYRRQTSQSGIDAGNIQPQGSNVDLQSPNCSLITISITVTKPLAHTAIPEIKSTRFVIRQFATAKHGASPKPH